jgi:hypothetical protein
MLKAMDVLAPQLTEQETPTFPAWLRGRPFVLGNRTLPSRYCLAPLAGYTNWSLRLTVRELGGLGLATTDLVNSRALLEGSKKTVELTHTTPDDKPLAIAAAVFLVINGLLARNGKPIVPYIVMGNYGMLLFAMLAFESYQLLQQLGSRSDYGDNWDDR